MNTVPTMKLVSLFSRLAILGLVAFGFGIASDTHPLALFSFATSALVLLVVSGDYAPHALRPSPRCAAVVDFPPAPARDARSENRAA